MRPPAWVVVVLVGALAGLVFAGVSTYDFVQHLDRQVHSLHCSFIPGGGAEAGASGCQVAMMSPYSSVFRTTIWGGIPISLPAMAVFAFLVFYGLDLILARRTTDPRATAFLALATALPALASLAMLVISLTQLGTTCKLCVGIYIASALCLAGAIVTWRRAVGQRATRPDAPAPARASAPAEDEPAFVKSRSTAFAATEPALASSRDGRSRLEVQVEEPTVSGGALATMFGVGVLFVAAPVATYAAMAPDHGRFVGTCGELVKPDDTYGVMVPMQRGGGVPALEILDPLCPACKAFEQRLAASGFAGRLDRKAILFPLDTTCNWMITENTHPGACTVSEAVLCAGDRAPAVLAWAFEVQDRIRAETSQDPGAAARMVAERFPELASCVGSPEAKSRLNKSLRWSVANNIRVLTPQLFVDGVKLCDEDVDLGLDYALARMLDGDMPARSQLAKPVETTPPPPSANERTAPTTAQPAPPADPGTTAGPAAGSTDPAAASSAPATPPAPASDKAPAPASDKPPAAVSDKPPATDKAASDTTPAPASDKAPAPASDKAPAPASDKPPAPASDKPPTPKPDKPPTPATDKPVTSPSEVDKTAPAEEPGGAS